MNQRGNRYPPRGNPGSFGNSPAKSSHALVSRGPINLITNNFKIKSQSNGIIYTYSVEFIDGEQQAPQTTTSANPETSAVQDATSALAKMSIEESKEPAPKQHRAVVRDLAVDNLETFQKYKILGAQANKLKSIFVNYISVGNNIFSTSQIDEKIDFETK